MYRSHKMGQKKADGLEGRDTGKQQWRREEEGNSG